MARTPYAFRGDLRDDFLAAVDWATTTPWVDGSRLAVLGHSMGAGAALDFATVDNRAKAVVPVSGGWIANDAVTPAHTLFLVGSGDPDRIAERQDTLARQLRKAGGQVTEREISADHITILRDGATIGAITEFLDPLLGLHRVMGPPRASTTHGMNTAVLYLLVVLALIAVLGLAVGQAVPVRPALPAGATTGRCGRVFPTAAVAMLLAMPLLAVGWFDLLPIGAGQTVVMHLLLASGLLWGGRALAERGQLLGGRLGGWLGERPVAVAPHGRLGRTGRLGRDRLAPDPDGAGLPPPGADPGTGPLLGGDEPGGAAVLCRLRGAAPPGPHPAGQHRRRPRQGAAPRHHVRGPGHRRGRPA